VAVVAWRQGRTPHLRTQARRESASVRADIADAYGRSGFQPSAIFFPTVGCWKITGTVGDASLTFVTIVLKASRYSA
jgi:hypothetical protein